MESKIINLGSLDTHTAQHVRQQISFFCQNHIYDLTGNTNLQPACPYLKTVGSGIPGSAPRLKPVNQKQKERYQFTF